MSVGSKVGAAMAREGLEEGSLCSTMGEIWVLGRRLQLRLHLSGVATLTLGNYQDPALVRMD